MHLVGKVQARHDIIARERQHRIGTPRYYGTVSNDPTLGGSRASQLDMMRDDESVGRPVGVSLSRQIPSACWDNNDASPGATGRLDGTREAGAVVNPVVRVAGAEL